MATVLRRPVNHDDRLSLVEHLDELRSRLIVCVLGLVVAFGFCFWQADGILKIVNKPLEQTQNLEGTKRSNDPLEQNARFQILSGRKFRADAAAWGQQARSFGALAAAADSAAERRQFLAMAAKYRAKVNLVGPSPEEMNDKLAESLDISGRGVKYLDSDPKAVLQITFDSLLSASRTLGGSNPTIRIR